MEMSAVFDLPLWGQTSTNHFDLMSRQVSSGLYSFSRLVVGWARLMALTKSSLLGPRRAIPLCENPMTLVSNASRSEAFLVIVVLVVLAASSTVRMFCAAAP